MVKIWVQGTSEETKEAIEILKNSFEILQISNEYKNRNSEYVRIYVDITIKKGQEEVSF